MSSLNRDRFEIRPPIVFTDKGSASSCIERMHTVAREVCKQRRNTRVIIGGGDGWSNTVVTIFESAREEAQISPEDASYGFVHANMGMCNVIAPFTGTVPEVSKILAAINKGRRVVIDQEDIALQTEGGKKSTRALIGTGFNGVAVGLAIYEKLRGQGQRIYGLPAYAKMVLSHLKEFHPVTTKISGDRGVIFQDSLVVFCEIANGPKYANGLNLTNQALDSGRMTLMYLLDRGETYTTAVALLIGIVAAHAGLRRHNPFLKQLEGKTFSLTFSEKVQAHYDAELEPCRVLSAEVVNLPHSLAFYVPPDKNT